MPFAAALFAWVAQSCGVVGGLVFLPVHAMHSGPAPTLDALEAPELADRASGTLIVADGSDTVTLIDLPTLVRRNVVIGDEVVAATAPDEAGRIVYVRREWPWHQALLAALFLAGEQRAVLAVRSVDRDDERVLCEVRADRRESHLQLSRSGDRVLYFAPSNHVHVFDASSGRELSLPPLRRPILSARLREDGSALVYRTNAQLVDGDAPVSSAPRSDVEVEVDLTTMQQRELDASAPTEPSGELSTLHHVSSQALRDVDRLPGNVGATVLALDETLFVYSGLACADAGARQFFSLMYPAFETSLRLGDTRTGATLTLFERFARGTFEFTPVRLAR